jgi:hypothetical protein
MKNRKVALIAIAGVGFFLWFLVQGTLDQKKYRVEVCMDFEGRSNCAAAVGPTEEQALRAATQTACATISSGMTESMACDRTRPKSVRWLSGR